MDSPSAAGDWAPLVSSLVAFSPESLRIDQEYERAELRKVVCQWEDSELVSRCRETHKHV